jgi:hypothetical protein
MSLFFSPPHGLPALNNFLYQTYNIILMERTHITTIDQYDSSLDMSLF